MLKYSPEIFASFQSYLNMKPLPGDIEKHLIKKTQKYFSFFRFVPGIKMIAIGNSVAMNSAKESSDIDLFIVCEERTMWFVRIILTTFFSLLDVKKTSSSHEGRFCLSFFMTDTQLSLETIAIENDVYLYFRILFLKPIINYNTTYEKFIEENKQWCDFTGYENILEENKKTISFAGNNYFGNNPGVSAIDGLLKKIFLPRALRSFERLGKPEGVVIDDNMLKFHDMDKRKQIRDNVLRT